MSDCGDVKKVFVPAAGNAPATLEKPIIGVEITDLAAEKIKLFLGNENKSPEEYGLKISVVKDGCSGKSYTMSLDKIQNSIDDGDKLFKHNGATVMIEKLSYLFVTGSRLDFVEALTGSGFNLTNPNVKKTCACGSSFAV
ncbi:iron-sulfur cluster assembly accessory protein [bacterium]|nr:iron-sulfur cluster assembly accessory protein [bacterium]